MNYLLYLFLFFSTLIFSLSIYFLIKLFVRTEKSETSNTKNLSQIDKKSPNFSDIYNTEILFATIQQQMDEFHKKVYELHQKLSSITKAEILQEIENLNKKIKNFEYDIEKIKNLKQHKKQELKKQIEQTFSIFEKIKTLLMLDYENLVKQKEQLKKYLQSQELKYQHIIENYNTEIQNLNRLISELKNSYPEELLEKLKINVSEKTQILEKLKKEYEILQQTTKQNLVFLNEVVNKK